METNESSFFGRHQFLIYRLFSLAGLIPVGAYIVVHLLTNASILNGPATYQAAGRSHPFAGRSCADRRMDVHLHPDPVSRHDRL